MDPSPPPPLQKVVFLTGQWEGIPPALQVTAPTVWGKKEEYSNPKREGKTHLLHAGQTTPLSKAKVRDQGVIEPWPYAPHSNSLTVQFKEDTEAKHIWNIYFSYWPDLRQT